jgi:quercetin dioxygenase-like cupin family protein
MQLIKLENVTPREVQPGHSARFVHADHMTVAHWRIDAGSSIPEHEHPHEQVVNVIAAGKPLSLEPGMVVVIPGGVRHSGRAVTDAILLDVFHPVREDYR